MRRERYQPAEMRESAGRRNLSRVMRWLKQAPYVQPGRKRHYAHRGLTNLCSGDLDKDYTVQSSSRWPEQVRHDNPQSRTKRKML
jgi:hypothetical protein